MNEEYDSLKNVGYVVLNEIYRVLKLKEFWHKKQKSLKIQYDLEAIFRLIVFSRILFPGSKKATYEGRNKFFEKFDFELEDVYRALDIFASETQNLQNWIFEHSLSICERNMENTYFDCTNYYFEIDNNDNDLIDEEGNILEKKYRKRGPEKNHRPDPIIEMGLFMDSSGLPISYTLFPGNESEKVQLRPFLKSSRPMLGMGRIIVVADRGLNTSDNMFYLAGKNNGDERNLDGYIYGQSVRGADAEFKKWILDQDGYLVTEIPSNDESDLDYNNENKTIKFKHKSRIYPKKIQINREKQDKKPHKATVTITQKQMVYYSRKYAMKQASDRKKMVERAKDLIANPKKYDRVTSKGASSYVENITFDKNTGEITSKKLLLDEAKIEEESKYDGYYSIVTSELDMDDIELRNRYRGLAKIEDTFKVTKSNLESRPVYVWTTESIEAHFMTCFTSLVILRLLESKLGNKYSVSKIIESLKKYSAINIETNEYQMVYYDSLLKECEEVFDINLSKKYKTQREMRTLLKY